TVPVGASPLTMTIDNARSTPAQPLTYTFEVATDSTFATRVFVQDGVPQGEGGRTSVTVGTGLEPGVHYAWGARAAASGVSGPVTAPWAFSTAADRALGTPVVLAPATGTVLRE